MRGTGHLAFVADDGCVIRRNGTIVHDDRSVHSLTRHTLWVEDGDLLEVAHWQHRGEWQWGAFLESRPVTAERIAATLLPYLPFTEARLARPDGPPLKVYTNAAAPARTILAVYSLILNGYCPSEVLLYGSNQWSDEIQRLVEAALPFARIVPVAEVDAGAEAAGGGRISAWAREHGLVMKAAVMLLTPPKEFCFLDDDVFVLGPVEDALAAFATHDLVHGQDFEHGPEYLSIWRGIVPDCPEPLPTGRLNTGFIWLRNRHDPRLLAEWLQCVDPASLAHAWYGEQGFVAVVFARAAYPLSPQRYVMPAVDGLPGGIVGYDYRANPCGYASVHFAGPWGKPTDQEALLLAPEILGDPEAGGFCPVT